MGGGLKKLAPPPGQKKQDVQKVQTVSLFQENNLFNTQQPVQPLLEMTTEPFKPLLEINNQRGGEFDDLFS